ncbi:restriction endonuclease subunit S [Bradyrhizobium japonicum]|uniref:restriction endonuclease subunit S n=1 Tax=Bradyrhizobium japonicum TaxID=375 RepID=UPI0004B9F612|nr:restriction endonuclease subunit S [Bradyrhizobium japonicum]
MKETTLRGLLADSRDGEWGKGEFAQGRLEMRVIRGTDFPDIRQGEFGNVPVRYLEQKHADRKRVQLDDILIETAGGTADRPTGRTARVTQRVIDELGSNITCASFARFLRIDRDQADPHFIFWLLQYHYTQGHLRQFHLQHTGVARFQFTTFADTFPLLLPSRDEQCRIASILGAYDELVEVNRRRISLLKEAGRRVFDQAIAAHANNEGKDTSVSELIERTLGGDWGNDTETPGEPCEVRAIRGTDFRRIEAGDFTTAPTRYISQRSFDRRVLRPFDLVVENSINAKSRNAGTPLFISAGIIDALGGAVVATSFCRQLRCESAEAALVLFHFMDRIHSNNEIQQFQVVAANGIANFQSEDFMRRASVPLSQDRIHAVGKSLAPFSATIFQQQIFNLIRQRDLLLPRLLSGRLSVASAERELEAVA